MKRFLTPQEREDLKAQHRLERDKRICDRIKAMLLSDDGWSYKEIARVLLLSEDAVKRHIEEYHESQKLKPENGGSLGKLNEEQSKDLIDHNMKLTYGWIRRGERKELPTNSGRQRLNLSGAIDIISKKVLVREDVTLNAESTIAFLKQVEEAYPSCRKIHIFCDNARYYRNKLVHEYLVKSKIEMHFLPSYSPNLNPIERLWKFMYEHILYNKYYEKFSEFKEAVLGFLQSLLNPSPEMKELLDRRITDNFHIINSQRGAA